MANDCCKNFSKILFHYETVKIVDIKNKKVGALYRFIQLIILAYVIGYVIVYKKGYQDFDNAISTVTTKLKGTSYVNYNNVASPFHENIEVYDPADYVVPPQENNAFFVMTNMIITPNQTRSRCPEDPKFSENKCQTDKDCLPALKPIKNGNGVRTGRCVLSDRPNISYRVCEIYGWCPTETDILPMPGYNFSASVPLLDDAKEFTVLLKNEIIFPKFKVQRRNIVKNNISSYLKTCFHNHETDPLCPIFKIKDVIQECNDDFEQVAYLGAVYGILVNWDCNLDLSLDKCTPTYSTRRLDDPDAPISPGFNFRFANYYVVNNKQYRTLYKAYGLKFEIIVTGKAGKFSVIPLFTNLGAGLALLGIAVVWCDFIVMYLLKKRFIYKEYKYQKIDDDEETNKNEAAEEVGDRIKETSESKVGYQLLNDEDNH
ncbi:P2X purinoceptor 4 isoform X3 [Hydra vulgaris]|uniref:P2X purinoceptor 4 isoform X3 n=1 Tax=Hydra vulgaris TaxID=6087 RepID=A0ABM4CQX0_HYDVU